MTARATEHELDVTGKRTGRIRRAQFHRTMRLQAVPPSQRGDMPFEHRVSAGKAPR